MQGATNRANAECNSAVAVNRSVDWLCGESIILSERLKDETNFDSSVIDKRESEKNSRSERFPSVIDFGDRGLVKTVDCTTIVFPKWEMDKKKEAGNINDRIWQWSDCLNTARLRERTSKWTEWTTEPTKNTWHDNMICGKTSIWNGTHLNISHRHTTTNDLVKTMTAIFFFLSLSSWRFSARPSSTFLSVNLLWWQHQ